MIRRKKKVSVPGTDNGELYGTNFFFFAIFIREARNIERFFLRRTLMIEKIGKFYNLFFFSTWKY